MEKQCIIFNELDYIKSNHTKLTYYQKCLIILTDAIKRYKNTLTQKQCSVISKCYKKLSEIENINDEVICKKVLYEIDNDLMDVNINWLSYYI